MKIIYLYPSLRTLGGADRMVIQKANYLTDQLDHEVYIITDSQDNFPFVYPLSSKVHHIDTGINFNRQYQYNFVIRIVFYQYMAKKYRAAVTQLIDKIHPDIVISTLGRDSDFITKLKDGSKKIGEAHTTRVNLRNVQGLLDGGIMQKYAGKQLKQNIEKTIRELDAFVVLNEYEQKIWSDIKPAIVIPNSLPFHPSILGTLSAPRAICVGRLEWEKGIDRLIDVWQRVHEKHPGWILDIYGEGTLQNQLQQQIFCLKAENYIHLKGACSNIMTEYLSSSIVVLTSRYEGFGMVLIEAMACGVPCVAYNCRFGPQSIITDAENGFLVEEGDKEKMVEKIGYLIDNEPIRKTMGINARKTVQKYSQDNIMKEWNDLFNSLTKKS